MELILKTVLAVVGTSVAFLFGAWHVSITILFIMFLMDYFTGIMKAIYLGRLRSSIGIKGIVKKVGMICLVIMANLLDLLIGSGLPVFRTMVIFFLVANEAISILENLEAIGIKIPLGLRKKFEQMSKKDDIN